MAQTSASNGLKPVSCAHRECPFDLSQSQLRQQGLLPHTWFIVGRFIAGPKMNPSVSLEAIPAIVGGSSVGAVPDSVSKLNTTELKTEVSRLEKMMGDTLPCCRGLVLTLGDSQNLLERNTEISNCRLAGQRLDRSSFSSRAECQAGSQDPCSTCQNGTSGWPCCFVLAGRGDLSYLGVSCIVTAVKSQWTIGVF